MTQITMDSLLANSAIVNLVPGQVVDAKIISIKKNKAWLDLGPFGLGQVTRREVGAIGELKTGDSVQATVIEGDLPQGYSLMSLRAGNKEKSWDELELQANENKILEVVATDFNKGGLIIEFAGARGFMPVSQLSAEHSPKIARTSDDKEAIAAHLKSLVGLKLKVKIITADKNLGKLIFSEREAAKELIADQLKDLKVGEKVKGKVTGITDFGIFVDVNGVEGLVHISEISWQRIDNPRDWANKGDDIEAEIVNIDQDRLSLSMKKLLPDPWQGEAAKIQVGDKVKGTVTRITPFGAFVQINPVLEALVHIAEIEDKGGSGKDSKAEQILQLGQESTFVISEIDKEAKRISLTIK